MLPQTDLLAPVPHPSADPGPDPRPSATATSDVPEAPAPPTAWRFAEGDDLSSTRTILRALGGGVRFEAYVAWDAHLHAPIVVKVLRPHLVGERRAQRALAREAEALTTLQHPDLVRSFGAVLDGPRPHLVLEFLDGPRLSTLIRRFGALSPEQSILLARRLASALAYIAAEGWVHLDVKPRNVVVTATPRLIDLSLARPLEAARGRTGIGTDVYMAPEQCDPDRADEIGSPADVWGLGVTLFEAVAGSAPWPRTAGGPAFPQLVQARAGLPGRVPAELADLIDACLADRPADRPTAAEVDDRLEPLTDWATQSSRRLR
jgi:serine/threonine protein kinase